MTWKEHLEAASLLLIRLRIRNWSGQESVRTTDQGKAGPVDLREGSASDSPTYAKWFLMPTFLANPHGYTAPRPPTRSRGSSHHSSSHN